MGFVRGLFVFSELSFQNVNAGTSVVKFCLKKLVHEVADEIEWTKSDQWVKFILKAKGHNSIVFNEIQ